MWMRWCGVVVLIVAFLSLAVRPVLAHPGGLNRNGCHNNRKTGDYHCHRAQPAPTPPPKRSPPPKSSQPRTEKRPPIKRSAAARAAFRRNNPCPATKKITGPCPGWEVDHIKPLACGGPDTPDNMQWLTAKENRKKGSMGCRRK